MCSCAWHSWRAPSRPHYYRRALRALPSPSSPARFGLRDLSSARRRAYLDGYRSSPIALCLILLVRSVRKLLATVTAFTVAHSITLAAATLGLVNVPAAPVEASIALSIVFLRANCCEPPRRGAMLRDPIPGWWLSVLDCSMDSGFAGALAEIGLPHGEIPLALFSFNVGVESVSWPSSPWCFCSTMWRDGSWNSGLGPTRHRLRHWLHRRLLGLPAPRCRLDGMTKELKSE